MPVTVHTCLTGPQDYPEVAGLSATTGKERCAVEPHATLEHTTHGGCKLVQIAIIQE